MDLRDVGAIELARRLRCGEVLVADHLAAVLARIEERDGDLRAFSCLNPDAMRQAHALDWVPLAQRADLPLFGVPVAIKEELHVAGMVTTFGGKANTTPAPDDSEVVSRLRRAGAIIIGKTNMPEFGQTPFTEGQWGATANPFNPQLSPGGSSGGSAVAVAARMVPLAIGGDAGGSVRIPAAMTGVVGIKPSRGRVSTAPFDNLWHDLGTYGPLARDVADVDLALAIIAPTEPAGPVPEKLRVGWTLSPPVPGIKPQPEVGQAVAEAAQRLAAQGCEVTHGSIRWAETPATFVIQYHLGVLDEVRAVEHPQLLELRSQRVAALARLLPRRALSWSRTSVARIEDAMARLFTNFDILLTPVAPTLPTSIRPVHSWGYLRSHRASSSGIAYTSYWNLAGLPAASVPVGLSVGALPLAVQVVGRRGADAWVLDVARRLHRSITPPAYQPA